MDKLYETLYDLFIEELNDLTIGHPYNKNRLSCMRATISEILYYYLTHPLEEPDIEPEPGPEPEPEPTPVTEKCANVNMSATGDLYSEYRTVTLSCGTVGSTIHYTTDGSDPKTSGSVLLYSAPFTLAAPGTTAVKAYASKEGYLDGDVATTNFTLKQVKNVTFLASGSETSGSRSIFMMCESDRVAIHYTLDGSTPTSSSPVYDSGNIPVITETTTIKAYATKSGWTPSDITQETIIINVPEPVVTSDVYYGYLNSTTITAGQITSLSGHKETLNPAGNYTATTDSLAYLWICIDPSQTITYVTSDGGFEVPMESPVTVGGFKCYCSEVRHRAGTINFIVHT